MKPITKIFGLLCLIVQATLSSSRSLINQSHVNHEINRSWSRDENRLRLRLGEPSGFNEEPAYCPKDATCYKVQNATCFGVKLPYSYSSLDLVGSLQPSDIPELLDQWRVLRRIPKCWATVQPFLCSIYMPKCDPNSNQMDFPYMEMCKVISGHCRILKELDPWPFFRCDNIKMFSAKTCKNDVLEMKFNTTSECPYPLIPTDNPSSYYDGVEGCGVMCQNPLLTEDEHEHIHKMVAFGATISLLCNFFTVASFFIDWRSGNKYPALIIFYINLCFLISNVGWLIQFIPGTREDIVCRKDGTRRFAAPSAGENLSCVIIFVLVYYFLMAACVWFVILTYAWHLSFSALGKIPERIDKKGAYFHLVAWSSPLVLTITTLATGQIDGDSVAGVCFVGYSSYFARAGLVLAPISVMVLVGGYFLFRGLKTLIEIKIGSQEIISRKASAKIKETIVKIGIFSLFCLIFVIVTFICHIYEFRHGDEWEQSLRKYIICQITASDARECKMTSKPSVAVIQLHLIVLFGAGIVMSFWVWTSSTMDTWKRFLKRVVEKENEEEPLKLKKHKLIAQAFARRKELNCDQRISFIFHSTHTDPVGLNFELNSGESQNLSRTWTEALHKLLTRRGALITVPTESNSSRRRNSYDSEISYNVRRVSVESRRQSLDSQVSVQIAELITTRKTSGIPQHSSGGRSRTKRRRGKDFNRSKRHQSVPRRGSSTSQESQLNIQILSALTMANSNILPSLFTRRLGNAGLDIDDPLAGKFSLPVDLTDDDNSNGDIIIDEYNVTCGASEDDPSNSEDDLCAPGEGIQNLDSDTERLSKSKNLPRITYEDDDSKLKRRNEKRFKNGSVSRLDKYNFPKDRPRTKSKKCSRDNSELDRRRKRRDVSSEDEGRKKKSVSSSKKRHAQKNDTRSSKMSNKTDDAKISEFDTDYDDNHSVQSRGVQMDFRCGSSRSKTSVDVSTQISSREIATQTDPHDFNGLQCSTSTQGTQMTPPFHVRLFNKKTNATTSRGGNYSYSALSLTEPNDNQNIDPVR